MIVLSTFLLAFAQILDTIVNIYIWVIIINSLISWVRPDPYNPIVQILNRLSEPAYNFIRRFIPTVIGGIDLAPIIIILFLQFISLFFVKLVYTFASSL
jgi:YggT family protein